jgi:hypothetical protein
MEWSGTFSRHSLARRSAASRSRSRWWRPSGTELVEVDIGPADLLLDATRAPAELFAAGPA